MFKLVYWRLIAIIAIITVIPSCGMDDDVPMNMDELGMAPPKMVPLVFGAEKKLLWDTTNANQLRPEIKKLDIEALPVTPFDSTGSVHFGEPPKEVRFDYNSLPSVNFDLAKLPSKSMEMKVSLLPPISSRKVQPPAISKDRSLAIYEFGPQQGFTPAFVADVYSAKNGLLWIAGQQDLYRYDGVNLQKFVEAPDNAPVITGMTEDGAGNIWYVTLGGGISMVDLHNGTIGSSDKILAAGNNVTKLTTDHAGNIWIYNFKDTAISIIDPITRSYKNLDQKSGLSGRASFQVVEDKQHNIWISTYTEGISIIDAKGGKIKYLHKVNGLSNDSISSITVDPYGRVWMSDPGGMNAIDIQNGIITQYGVAQGYKQSTFTFSLVADSSGNIWRCSDARSATKIELLNVKNGTMRQLSTKDGLIGDIVFSCAADKYNRMWLASTAGLQCIDQGAEVAHVFGNTSITSQMEDDAGNLWVAMNNGLTIVNTDKNSMRVINTAKGLVNDFVQSFTRIGNKMGVASNGGISIIDPVGKTITNIGRNQGLVSDTIYGMTQDKNGLFWLTGPSNGATILDPTNYTIRHTDQSKGLSDNNIQDVKTDKDGLVWLATNKHGVDVYDPKTGMVKNLYNQPGLTDTCNRVLVADDEGRMWIGTDKGIYVADIKRGTLTCINAAQGLSANAVLSLLKYQDKIIAGAKNKVNIITPPKAGEDSTKWDISVLDKSQGLIKQNNSWASDLVTKSGNYLWGDRGISIMHGIKPARDSTITYVAGIQIVNRLQNFVNQDKDAKNKKTTVDDQQQNYTWDSVSGPYNLPINLAIPYYDNYLQFQFVQANSGRQDSVFYSYFLEGIDKHWSAPTINTFTENYLNLPAGHYSFKVSSKGVDGRWGVPASFSFTITPPWYKTWWAYVLYGLIGIALLRGYIVYRSRRLKKENKLLEEKVQLRTKQLQESIEELKTTQAQLVQSEKMASLGELTAGIAHEIQNPLNFVNNFSEINTELLEELKQERAKDKAERDEEEENSLLEDITQNMEKIAHHGKRADGIVKGMLQHSRSSSSVKEPTDLNKLADEYFRLAYHGLRAKDKSFNATMNADYDENIQHIHVVPQDMGRVILNLITNAFYSVNEKKKRVGDAGDAAYEPTVSVATKKLGNKVVIEVEDNGNGVPQKVLDKIFQPFFTTKPTGQGTGLGLSLSYDIVKAHGGELKVETDEHRFARFTITLPA